MAKSPAFQFYPDDFMGGAPSEMSPDETHVYVWLLCRDWNQGGFEYEPERLARFCRLPLRRFAKAWTRVAECFTERDGRYYNPRLDKERAKQHAWREKSSRGGKAGAKTRWPEHDHPYPDGDQGGDRVVTPFEHSPVSSLQSPSPEEPTAASPAREVTDGETAFLAAMPDTRRAYWRAVIESWYSGQNYPQGRAADARDVSSGLLEYLASGDQHDFKPKHVRAFVMGAEAARLAGDTKRRPSRRSQADETYDAALAGALAVQQLAKEKAAR